jgi:hypothetical protein
VEDHTRTPTFHGAHPARGARVVVALLLGAVAAAYVLAGSLTPGWTPDSVYPLRAAQLLMDGVNPYHALPGGLPDPFLAPLYYPLTTAIAVLPVAGLDTVAATALLMGASVALLAYALTARGWWWLYALATGPLVMAVRFGQWSPLVTAAALLPAWSGVLLTLKPNLGLPVLLYAPSWGRLWAAAGFTLLSLALLPRWPLDWLHAAGQLVGHPPPVLLPGGALALLALTRWRRPEARLVVAMACVPQLLFFADQLPLWLVARTRRELLAWAVVSFLGIAGHGLTAPVGPGRTEAAAPWVLLTCYLPAVVMVLRRPNEGPVPAWLERRLQWVPSWLRGVPA